MSISPEDVRLDANVAFEMPRSPCRIGLRWEHTPRGVTSIDVIVSGRSPLAEHNAREGRGLRRSRMPHDLGINGLPSFIVAGCNPLTHANELRNIARSCALALRTLSVLRSCLLELNGLLCKAR